LAAVADGEPQNARENAVHVADVTGREAGCDKLRDPGLNVAVFGAGSGESRQRGSRWVLRIDPYRACVEGLRLTLPVIHCSAKAPTVMREREGST
jgi:hypothetical protein